MLDSYSMYTITFSALCFLCLSMPEVCNNHISFFQGSSASFLRKIYNLFQQEHTSNQGWSLYICRSSHHYCPFLHFFVTSFLLGLSEDWYENTNCMLLSHLSQGEDHFAFISMNAFEVFKEFTCTLPWLENYLKIDKSQVKEKI